MKAVIVSGVPGTGKTFVAKRIAKQLKAQYMDVNNLIKENKLYNSYDKKFKSYVVDEKKFKKFFADLIKKSKKLLIIDSHLSHLIDRKYVKLCVITKCDLKILKKRLMKRKWSKEKIKVNMESEILDICYNEALENKHKIQIIDTSKGLKDKRIVLKL